MNYYIKTLSISFSLILISACGGGGGSEGAGDSSGGGYGNTNTAPTVTNTTLNISVQENKTTAFTVTATDSNGDSLTYSISGDDSSLMSISSAGVVTFKIAPDFEVPADANADNVYIIVAAVSDGSLSDSKTFQVTVTNDTSDDITTSGYDGVVINGSYVQSAKVCIEETVGEGCSSASISAETAMDGSFSFEVDSTVTGALIAEGGFNPNTNYTFADELKTLKFSGDARTDQNMVVSELSNMMTAYSDFTFEALKSSLDINQDFMIRFNDPYSNLNDADNAKVALINNQLLILKKVLTRLDPAEADDASTDSVEYKLAKAIATRTSSEKSLADTTFIRNMMLNWNFDNFTLTNSIAENLSAGLSSYLQKMYVDGSNNAHDHMTYAGLEHLPQTLDDIVNGTATDADLETLFFDTLTYITAKADTWSGTAFTDTEAYLNETVYKVGNSGSSYYTVDGINAKATALVIYAIPGQIIKFEATSNSVFSAHPFEISTQQDDTAGANNIGITEGWDQSSNTLTVNAFTPSTLYPHCGVHSGMYTNGKIEIVTTFDQSKLDITSATSGLEVKGTVSSGPYKGASGYTHKVYLRTADAGSSQHQHSLKEYPGITFYMPADQGYHGQDTSSGEPKFKAKSHFESNSSDSD
jgi:hypothetical protein